MNTSIDDRLLTRREVSHLLGSKCVTGHVIRGYAKQGLIRVVKLNSRTFRYGEASVKDFIQGRTRA